MKKRFCIPKASLIIGCVFSIILTFEWIPTAAEVLSPAPFRNTGWYIFTSFRSNGQDGLHLAVSRDAYNWFPLNDNKSFLKPEVGGKLMRDPSIAQGPDGVYHMVWTTGWTADDSKMFGYSSSTNLIHWTPQKGIPVMENEPNTRNVWAPEIFYDDKSELWYIIWSSTVTGKFPDETGVSEDQYNHRAYYVTTKDFETFSESKLFFDPGFNIIDSTLKKEGDLYLLFFKDERLDPPQKNIRMAFANSIEGPYQNITNPFTIHWVEGPSVLKIGQTWICYFDHYIQPHYYGAVCSSDLKQWEDCSKEMKFPAGHRHGTVLEVPQSIAEELIKLGTSKPVFTEKSTQENS